MSDDLPIREHLPIRDRIYVVVNDNSIEGALHRLKRTSIKTGFFREIKRHEFYLPPGEARRRKQKVARAKARKTERRKLAGEPNDEVYGTHMASTNRGQR